MSRSKSRPEYLPGQRTAISDAVFGGESGMGGIFQDFLAGKPNAGFDRAQGNALQQLQRTQAQSGIANTPLGTRQQADFLQKSTQAAGDQFYQQLQPFMQPGGTSTLGASGLLGGKGNCSLDAMLAIAAALIALLAAL